MFTRIAEIVWSGPEWGEVMVGPFLVTVDIEQLPGRRSIKVTASHIDPETGHEDYCGDSLVRVIPDGGFLPIQRMVNTAVVVAALCAGEGK